MRCWRDTKAEQVAAQPAPRFEITSDPMKDQVHRSSLSSGHRVRYTNNYHTETAGNGRLIYIEPEHPKPKPSVSIKLIPPNPLHSASKSFLRIREDKNANEVVRERAT